MLNLLIHDHNCLIIYQCRMVLALLIMQMCEKAGEAGTAFVWDVQARVWLPRAGGGGAACLGLGAPRPPCSGRVAAEDSSALVATGPRVRALVPPGLRAQAGGQFSATGRGLPSTPSLWVPGHSPCKARLTSTGPGRELRDSPGPRLWRGPTEVSSTHQNPCPSLSPQSPPGTNPQGSRR